MTPGKDKRLVAVAEKGPNYLFHLMAVARAGFDSEYADRYREAVAPADLSFLEASRGRLSFQDGRTGDLANLAILLPAYLSLESGEALREYFGLLDRALGGHAGPFLERYGTHLARLDDWVLRVDGPWLSSQAAAREVLRTMGAVYARNFPGYEAEVWPRERAAIEPVAARFNAHFAGSDVIGRWERLTGRTFKTDTYEIVLVSAIENGPNANSLGYERNVFWSGLDFGYMTQFASHETGTHLLIDMVKELMGSPPGVDFDIVYRAYENLARFYNTLVLGASDIYEMPERYHGKEFDRVYRSLYAENSNRSPEEMLRLGIAEFSGVGREECDREQEEPEVQTG